mmetsp:Transcript_1293/g.2884  ORF Transcript_1293/g.2884 Transcript_1293/m.2884 type:complete len:214 (-) Transcript_1293:1153-1794(-)
MEHHGLDKHGPVAHRLHHPDDGLHGGRERRHPRRERNGGKRRRGVHKPAGSGEQDRHGAVDKCDKRGAAVGKVRQVRGVLPVRALPFQHDKGVHGLLRLLHHHLRHHPNRVRHILRRFLRRRAGRAERGCCRLVVHDSFCVRGHRRVAHLRPGCRGGGDFHSPLLHCGDPGRHKRVLLHYGRDLDGSDVRHKKSRVAGGREERGDRGRAADGA